jgi:hypothetical protein
MMLQLHPADPRTDRHRRDQLSDDLAATLPRIATTEIELAASGCSLTATAVNSATP